MASTRKRGNCFIEYMLKSSRRKVTLLFLYLADNLILNDLWSDGAFKAHVHVSHLNTKRVFVITFCHMLQISVFSFCFVFLLNFVFLSLNICGRPLFHCFITFHLREGGKSKGRRRERRKWWQLNWLCFLSKFLLFHICTLWLLFSHLACLES